MKSMQAFVVLMDKRQRSSQLIGLLYAVVKKFGDDSANQYVVALGWYGFVAIYPLLLVVITIFGFIGAASLGNTIVTTLHQFPVVGTQFRPEHASQSLHGSYLGLVIGLIGLIYGAQGVTQTVLQAMARVWNVAQLDIPGFMPRLARSLGALVIIGGAFLVNAAAGAFVTHPGTGFGLRIAGIFGMAVINVVLYLGVFWIATPGGVRALQLLPGAVLAGSGFTLLITVGSGLVQHQLRHSSETYGQFGLVIGLVGFLFLLAKISLYGAELNPVVARRLWPRSLRSGDPTAADDQVLYDIAHESLRRADQRIGVGFGVNAPEEAARDAQSSASSRLRSCSEGPVVRR